MKNDTINTLLTLLNRMKETHPDDREQDESEFLQEVLFSIKTFGVCIPERELHNKTGFLRVKVELTLYSSESNAKASKDF